MMLTFLRIIALRFLVPVTNYQAASVAESKGNEMLHNPEKTTGGHCIVGLNLIKLKLKGGRMKKIKIFAMLLFLCFAAQTAQSAVLFSDLGTSAPPLSLAGYNLIPFDQVPQAAIPDFTDVTIIPGSPIPGDLTTVDSVNKRTIGSGWATWSHGYTGVVYMGSSTIILNLPPNTGAFYFYAEPDQFALMTISAVTDSGTSSGDINVHGSSGANGYAFYTTAGESITSITVTTNDSFMAVGEFGIAQAQAEPPVPIPTMNEWGMIILSLLLAGYAFRIIKQKHARV